MQYSVPDYVHISPECKHLLSRIFVSNPAKRINIQEIKNHEWFLKNLPTDLVDLADRSYGFEDPNHPTQSIEEIMQIISEAREPEASTGGNYFGDVMDDMDVENDLDPDYDSSGEFVCAM